MADLYLSLEFLVPETEANPLASALWTISPSFLIALKFLVVGIVGFAVFVCERYDNPLTFPLLYITNAISITPLIMFLGLLL